MNLDEFDYELPSELIAQFPLAKRSASKLLQFTVHKTDFNDLKFTDLPGLLHAGDLLVFNNTRVVPARLFAKKESGGKVELLMERQLDARTMLTQLNASKTPRIGTHILFENGMVAEVLDRQGDFFIVRLKNDEIENLLNESGQVPLPPYINREVEQEDIKRYQTVYAKHNGAVAAPTAGLHFDNPMLDQLRKQGVEFAFVTLHVGAGTFQPVRADKIEEHRIHAEQVSVSQLVCDQIIECKKRGGRVIAIGTTSVRALETAAFNKSIAPYNNDTSLFIYPGYKFEIVDALITNFHLPKSSLLMLVSAFAGYETTMLAYRHAVAERYRFYSYGDAMFINQQQE